jgi:hypothetical protein
MDGGEAGWEEVIGVDGVTRNFRVCAVEFTAERFFSEHR